MQHSYSPRLGRWINRDRIAEAGGINLYGYVGNNPESWSDPEGTGPFCSCTSAGASAGTSAGGLGGLASTSSQLLTGLGMGILMAVTLQAAQMLATSLKTSEGYRKLNECQEQALKDFKQCDLDFALKTPSDPTNNQAIIHCHSKDDCYKAAANDYEKCAAGGGVRGYPLIY